MPRYIRREFESTTEFQASCSPPDLKKKNVIGGIGSLLCECGTPSIMNSKRNFKDFVSAMTAHTPSALELILTYMNCKQCTENGIKDNAFRVGGTSPSHSGW